ncbi:hypothetical protein PNEG_01053 [Pneumocystis murina B123]|uniref:Protein kinase domain-containing protein n=1 Tax=Pneumocystis murina (strain B123) TaxID=1069680 RepID=M7NUD4_PNEMU|nr:hypothetical protein PNEG_01053 [Pneumocystis murina B123]EMR10907.1 hypothetical protein PNEG_01053 [Pneumocystis murina B123]
MERILLKELPEDLPFYPGQIICTGEFSVTRLSVDLKITHYFSTQLISSDICTQKVFPIEAYILFLIKITYLQNIKPKNILHHGNEILKYRISVLYHYSDIVIKQESYLRSIEFHPNMTEKQKILGLSELFYIHYFLEILYGLLTINPSERMTLQKASDHPRVNRKNCFL